MIKETKKNWVYIVKDNGGVVHGATLVRFKANKIKEDAEFNLGMMGSIKLVHIIKEKLI